MSPNEPTPKQSPRGVRRIPQNSFLYDRLIPLTLVALTILMVIILVIAAAILFGVVRL